jgi:hypothetical protein
MTILKSGLKSNSIASCVLASVLAVALPRGLVFAALLSGSAQAQQTLLPVSQGFPSSQGASDFLPIHNTNQWGLSGSDGVGLSIEQLSSFPPQGPSRGTTNGLFDASQYAADCGGSIFMVNDPAYVLGGNPFLGIPGIPVSARQLHLCSATAVPVVNATFINQLTAAGLSYKIVYPIQDNGNGRAYIVWASNDVFEFGGSNFFNPSTKNFSTIAGYARIEGVGWQDQFQPFTFTPVSGTIGSGLTSGPPVMFAQGDAAGDAINALQSPLRGTTLRLSVPQADSSVGTVLSGFSVTMVTDAWLAGTPPPPQIPLSPPSAPPGNNPADPTNVTTPSSPAGSGTPSGGSDPSNPGSQYSWVAYCNSPNRDGTPRSADFVQSCLATHQP